MAMASYGLVIETGRHPTACPVSGRLHGQSCHRRTSEAPGFRPARTRLFGMAEMLLAGRWPTPGVASCRYLIARGGRRSSCL